MGERRRGNARNERNARANRGICRKLYGKAVEYALYAPNKEQRWKLEKYNFTDEDIGFAQKFIKWNGITEEGKQEFRNDVAMVTNPENYKEVVKVLAFIDDNKTEENTTAPVVENQNTTKIVKKPKESEEK